MTISCKAHVGQRWIAELLGVVFENGSYVTLYEDGLNRSRLQHYNNLYEYDPATEYLPPNSPTWWNVEDASGRQSSPPLQVRLLHSPRPP